jgi:D-methionine transport system substrate-binding protein
MLSRRALVLASLVLLSACARTPAGKPAHTVRVGATAVPHAEILEVVKPILAQQGVKLEVKVFNDYVQPNEQLLQGQLDANYFQTKPFLDAFNTARGAHLTTVAGVHIEPMGAYSRRHHAIAALPDGAQVVIPNEASNEGRALLLLQQAGLIKLTNPQNPLSTLKDIAANPKKLQIRELEGASLPRVLDQVDLAVINTNYALDAHLDPRRDALVLESASSPYVNYLVARPDDAQDPDVKALAAALTSPAVKAFIQDHYKGAVLPAF